MGELVVGNVSGSPSHLENKKKKQGEGYSDHQVALYIGKLADSYGRKSAGKYQEGQNQPED